MKKITKIIILAIATLFSVTSCIDDAYKLGYDGHVTEDMVSFTYAKATDGNPNNSDNVIQFTNTSNIPFASYSCTWDFGNEAISKERNPIAKYPDAGSYTVSLSIYGYDGHVVTKKQTVTIAKDDPSLFDTPTFRNLTGGPENTNGKTWVFDQHNLYTAEVKTALNADIRGHIGLGPINSFSQGWWGAGPNEKGDWKMYDFKFHFKQTSGLQMKITTNGVGYGRLACAKPIGGYDNVTVIWEQDVQFPYEGGNYTFSITDVTTQIGEDEKDYEKITLSGNAFMGYYCGTQDYYILYLTDEVMALSVRNTVEGQDWVFIFIREDLNVEPDIPSINEEQVTFTITQGSNEFIYDYSVIVDNPQNVAFTVEVQFGDGLISSDMTGRHEYIVAAGTYYARCVLTVNDKFIIKQQPVVINNDHPLYDINQNLTGGKSWKLRPHSQGSGIILTNQGGNEYWWVVDNNAAGSYAAYDDILTFYNGGKAKLENNGNSYMHESTAGLFEDGDPEDSFVTTEYIPSDNAKWEFVNVGGILHIKLTNVFPMYAISPEAINEGLYRVNFLTEKLMHITMDVGWGAWQYFLVSTE